MKAYGVIRRFYIKHMDQQDCLERGAKSKFMKISSKMRTTTRQTWKGKERSKVRKEIKALMLALVLTGTGAVK
jgi:hypothetical protein